MTYNYKELIEEIEEDINDNVISLEDTIYIIRKSFADDNGYFEIIDYEYNDIEDEPCECMIVSEVLKEMKKSNLTVLK